MTFEQVSSSLRSSGMTGDDAPPRRPRREPPRQRPLRRDVRRVRVPVLRATPRGESAAGGGAARRLQRGTPRRRTCCSARSPARSAAASTRWARSPAIGRLAAIVSGILMAVWGATTLLAALGVRVPQPARRAPSRPRSAPHSCGVRRQSPTARGAATGLLTTLLPCGWLYVFVATAAGTGRVPDAMLVMLVFWLGTLPMMVGRGRWRAADVRRLPAAPAARELPARPSCLACCRWRARSLHDRPGTHTCSASCMRSMTAVADTALRGVAALRPTQLCRICSSPFPPG